MANMVDRTFALAAERTQPALKQFLVDVFRGQFPKQTNEELSATVDAVAERMGAHVR